MNLYFINFKHGIWDYIPSAVSTNVLSYLLRVLGGKVREPFFEVFGRLFADEKVEIAALSSYFVRDKRARSSDFQLEARLTGQKHSHSAIAQQFIRFQHHLSFVPRCSRQGHERKRKSTCRIESTTSSAV